MLSYLKDGNSAPATEEMENAQDGQSPQQYLTVSGHGKKVRQSTLILGLLFAVAGLAVWFMIQKTTPQEADAAANEDQQQLDMALAQLSVMKNEMNDQMNSVSGRFDQFTNVNQIGVEELKKNPFRRELGFIASEEDTQDTALLKRQQLEQEAQRRSIGFELWSITSTPKGMCCMINDKVLYENDEINGMKVHSISENTVTLDFQGVPVQLKMEK